MAEPKFVKVTEVISAPEQGNPSYEVVDGKVVRNVPYDRFLIPPGVTMNLTIDFDGVVARKKSWTAPVGKAGNAMAEVREKVWTDCPIDKFESPEPEEL